MKIIFSRKGFDSGSGFGPSPIMPDRTLLSLPIPSEDDKDRYDNLLHNGLRYETIISNINRKLDLDKCPTCHVDPDLRANLKQRKDGWKPTFGQMGAPLSHLVNQGVSFGDLFLFFGWFKQTEFYEGKLRFKRTAPDLHIIYGYLQIGEIIHPKKDKVPVWLESHPHSKYESENNVIFSSSDTLSIIPDLPGSGILQYDDKRVLTKRGCSRSKWNLPKFFRNIEISGCRGWKDDYFQSPGRGQEFVFTPTEEALNWIKYILNTK